MIIDKIKIPYNNVDSLEIIEAKTKIVLANIHNVNIDKNGFVKLETPIYFKNDIEIIFNYKCNHYDTSESSDGYEVCNVCGAYLRELGIEM